MAKPTTSAESRFWLYIDFIPFHECWEWSNKPGNHGYGEIRLGGRGTRLVMAHRFSYELHHGPISEGLYIDHLCQNKLCVRPEHLEPVTPAENAQRYFRSLTHCKNGHAYTDANTRVYKGWRNCRKCHREKIKEQYYARKSLRKL